MEFLEETMSKIAMSGLGSAATRNLKFMLVPALLACTSLTGCGAMGQFQQTVSAAPIDLDHLPVVNAAPAATQPANGNDNATGTGAQSTGNATKASNPNLEYLGRVVLDSERKCNAFLGALTFEQNSVNTFTDITATIASAVSTAVTPPGTKSALSAVSSIASGSKTAIDTDVFDKAATSDFAAAIQRTYTADMKTYTTGLPQLTDPIIVSNEVAKIQSIHNECSLAQAESAIQAKLGAPPTEQNGTNTTNENANGVGTGASGKTAGASGGSKKKKKAVDFSLNNLSLPTESTTTKKEAQPTHAVVSGRGDW
jgi:hypothetical protein